MLLNLRESTFIIRLNTFIGYRQHNSKDIISYKKKNRILFFITTLIINETFYFVAYSYLGYKAVIWGIFQIRNVLVATYNFNAR